MRRIYAHMVVRNEVDRYLQVVLDALVHHVDVLFVYDDLSADGSEVMAAGAGAVVTRRPPLIPPFLQHEGQFRQGAWDAFTEAVRPCPGDWVLAIDADELLIAPQGLVPVIDRAEEAGSGAVDVPIPEAFGRDPEGGILRRIDGHWGNLSATRLFRYQDGGRIRSRSLACGSTPTYVYEEAAFPAKDSGLELLHLGYLDPDDRRAKHNRYAERPGHGSAHVTSILSRPTLTRWNGPPIDVWRGRH